MTIKGFNINVIHDKDYPEDFEHENGKYTNRCCLCGEMFVGHKRRVVCKLCNINPFDK